MPTRSDAPCAPVVPVPIICLSAATAWILPQRARRCRAAPGREAGRGPLPYGRLLHLLLGLILDRLQRSVEVAALDDRGQLRLYRGSDLGGKGAIVDAGDLAQPLREVLPHWRAPKERVGGLIGFAFAGGEQRAHGALFDQDFLVEIDIAAPDGLEEVDGLFLVVRR